ncbi:MAG: CPBP family intramembrane metalloprotease [Candidatus Omnitrophica bacterium]|nr:CPBP family intramembrane metalloprotease [Candidatus Omnitrophota bacterium]
MRISPRSWLFFIVLSVVSFLIWYRFTYPTFSFVDLSIDRASALKTAEDYLRQEKGEDPTTYLHAVVMGVSGSVDQYLQKAIGFEKEIKFLKEHDYDLFSWNIRFFRENQEEEYSVSVSAATGEIIQFHRNLKSNAARPDYGEEAARQKVIAFLKERFGFNPDEYIVHTHHTSNLDHRTDYSFSWEKKDVFLRWNNEEGGGGAKVVIGANISGDEIFSFSKVVLDIPQDFSRYIERQKVVGRNLSVLFRIIFFSILTATIFYVVVRRNDLVMHTVKNFCIAATGFLFFLHLLGYLNEFENILYNYPTTSSMVSYLWRNLINLLMDAFIVTITLLMPLLAAESLHYEVLKERKDGAFLHHLLSTFLSRNISSRIFLGYLVCIIMVGIQSFAFYFGQKYLGVWEEKIWMAQLSASYLPFLAAFSIGIGASLSEEVAFRVFGISYGKKFFKNIFVAIFISSVIWGYGHSTYAVFPMWFRGMEVTALGIFLCGVYLRYGLIPVLIGHYLFDVFWISAAYLLGDAPVVHFYSCLAVLLLPLVWAVMAYVANRSEEERPMRWKLSRHQIFNMEILKEYLRKRSLPKGFEEAEQLKTSIASHGWDIAVVETALEDLAKEGQDSHRRNS